MLASSSCDADSGIVVLADRRYVLSASKCHASRNSPSSVGTEPKQRIPVSVTSAPPFFMVTQNCDSRLPLVGGDDGRTEAHAHVIWSP